MHRFRQYILLVICTVLPGCARGGVYHAAINSDDVNERILAIRQAAEQRDTTAVPLLIDRLEDEDEAVRLFAILALDKLTGHRFGYDYSQPANRRARSVEMWREFLKDPQRAVSMERADRAEGGSGARATESGM